VPSVGKLERHGDVERVHMSFAVAGRPLYWVSAYRTGDVLVDSGAARGRPVLARYLAEHPVRTVLTTHEHEDHVGNHALFGAGTEVLAPRRAVEILEQGPPRLPLYRWIAWGAHGKAPGVARPLPDAVTRGGRRFRVLHTPGHSADHVVFVDEDAAAAFTGDAYLGRLKAVRAKEDVPLQMRSVRALAALDLAVLYPAHGPILERPRQRLLEVADHFDALREKATRLAEKGRSPRRIRQDLLGPEPWLTYYSLGAFSAENLVRSLLARPPGSS
jgi:glyoxylase-like metal-dependent hydrolase (beta-lactamase superfamily II)